MPFEGSGMRRHLSVPSPDALRAALAREVPRHMYYSSAYYKDPSHPIMVSKGWAGADVIFDLDADHLRQAEGKTYAQQLELAKERFVLLVDEFIRQDFGVDGSDLMLAFSGGRGYHAHVRKEEFLGLASAERRELVAYLSPEGVDFRGYLFPQERAAARPASSGDRTARTKEKGKRVSSETYPHLPAPDAPGWPGRLTRSLFGLFDAWERAALTAPQVAKELERLAQEYQVPNLTPELARAVARQLVDDGKMEKARQHLVLELGEGKGRGSPRALIDLVEHLAAISLGETDAPVTTDIHRLIRLPGSLHGGTGLRVVRLTRDELTKFDPLRDALLPPSSGGQARTRVALQTEVDHPLGGERVRGKEGELLDLPESHALFLVLRGEAVIPAPAS